MAAVNSMEVYIYDAYFNEEQVSAIRYGAREQYGEDIIFNRYESIHFRNNTVWEPPEWATYMYVFLVGAGGGGGSGNGGNTRGGQAGSPGSTHVSGYYLDGALKGQPIGIVTGTPGAGGNNGGAGQSGSATTIEIGSFTSRAEGGSGGAGSTVIGTAPSGGVWRHQTDPPQRARLNNQATTITRGTGGHGANTGGSGTLGNGGGGGNGGIFGNYTRGGNGGTGFVDIHFWGVDPYD